MNSRNDFVIHVLDLLEGLGSATSRAMFGGHGIYVDGIIVGLIVDDTLYLKVDDQNRPRFEQAQGAPFTYHNKKSGQVQAMSYWTIPADALDDAGVMVDWARTSLDASLRAKQGGRPGGKAVAKAGAKPAAKPAAKPVAKHAVKPIVTPSARPAARTASRPGAKPGAQAAARSAGGRKASPNAASVKRR